MPGRDEGIVFIYLVQIEQRLNDLFRGRKGYFPFYLLESIEMSDAWSTSLSGVSRNPVSSYGDIASDHLEPQESDSNDEDCTPSYHSGNRTRAALKLLYKEIYGVDSPQCLVSQSFFSLDVAHVVRRATKDNVSHCILVVCVKLNIYSLHCMNTAWDLISRRSMLIADRIFSIVRIYS
jgi:hypothetical protein